MMVKRRQHRCWTRLPLLRGEPILWNISCTSDHLKVACFHNHHMFYHLRPQKPWMDSQNYRGFEQQYIYLIQVSSSQKPRYTSHSLFATKLDNHCQYQKNKNKILQRPEVCPQSKSKWTSSEEHQNYLPMTSLLWFVTLSHITMRPTTWFSETTGLQVLKCNQFVTELLHFEDNYFNRTGEAKENFPLKSAMCMYLVRSLVLK